ncbi:uncharacterized protein LOC110030730 [Phalaenopsis equestris]|uniref:uncharacterized protein LOC110030730 n=1 Tax=Phalaenopsis equestris TaxID=78828 RepID=UPI0009E371C7|nr:uncharacterized protein LOC110030730 [Phalaenopsis equestris]
MTEVINNTDKRSKRRLPTWMQSNDTAKKENFGTSDGLYSVSGNQPEPQGAVSMIKSMSSDVDVVLAENKKNSDNKEILAKNYSKKSTRKPKKSDGSNVVPGNFSGTERNSGGDIVKCGMSMDTDRHLKISARSQSVKVLSQGMTEGAAELTVEDLISIAEEFLTSDKKVQNEQSAARKSECNSIPRNSSESSTSHSGTLNREIKFSPALSKCTQTRSSNLNNVAKKLTEESATSPNGKTAQSNGAVEDMLQLFLGPLLKKAPLNEPDPEITKELTVVAYKSDCLIRSSVDAEKLAVDAEKLAPLTKKKNSLKDKVTIFLG